VLPELLRVVFFQRGAFVRRNLWNIASGAWIWGAVGVLVDAFYRVQAVVFGTGTDLSTILLKMLVDQFLFSPLLCGPLTIGLLAWRDVGFRPSAVAGFFRVEFYLDRFFPTQVAGWCVWIPAVCVVYAMPPLLQLPVAVLIQVFWVLVLTFVNDRQAGRNGGEESGRA
jgi:hypothetical protein